MSSSRLLKANKGSRYDLYDDETRHFLCNLRNLRSYSRAATSAMNPITAKVVNAMSMFDIVINLHSINNKSCDKEENNPNKSDQQRMLRELIRYKVSYYSKTHYKLAYIIAILRKSGSG